MYCTVHKSFDRQCALVFVLAKMRSLPTVDAVCCLSIYELLMKPHFVVIINILRVYIFYRTTYEVKITENSQLIFDI